MRGDVQAATHHHSCHGDAGDRHGGGQRGKPAAGAGSGARAQEISVRYALGATSRQVLRQLLAEGMVLGLAGAALGLALAPEALRLLDPSAVEQYAGCLPFAAVLNWHVLGWSLLVTMVASLLFSLAPAMQFRNPRLAEVMQQRTGTSGGGSLKFRRSCVALQIGFSLLLIVAAGMFVRTISNLRQVDTGFATDHVLAFDLNRRWLAIREARLRRLSSGRWTR